jgi:ribose transport system permease protein
VTATSMGERVRAVDYRESIVYLSFFVILAFFAVVLHDDGFLTSRNLLNIVVQSTPIAIMAIGMVFVLSAGEIDLSIGSIVALSALVTAVVLRDVGFLAAIGAGLGTGIAIGAVNGLLTTKLRIPSFLVTLATMSLVAGLARTITNLEAVPVQHGLYRDLFGGGRVGPVSVLVLWAVAALAVAHHVYRHRRFGAHVLATGDNAQAAMVSGIRTARIKVQVLMVSGGTAAVAGMLLSGRLAGARYTLGEADLLIVIAAVIIGGTRLFGGKGTVVGAVVGALIMGMLNNGLILMGLSVADQMMARGVIIVVAVALSLREKSV